MKLKIKNLGFIMMLSSVLFIGCQSLQTSFGSYQINSNNEVMLTAVGYHNNTLFKKKKFVSFAEVVSKGKIQVHTKTDSVKLSKQNQINFNYAEANIDSLSKLKKPMLALSVFDKQNLIKQINEQVDIKARPNLEVVTEILIKYKSELTKALRADSKYYQFNSSKNSYELLYYINGKENTFTIHPNDIIGYKSLFLCCTEEHGKVLVKNLSDNKCTSNTFKTLNNNSKTENYERL